MRENAGAARKNRENKENVAAASIFIPAKFVIIRKKSRVGKIGVFGETKRSRRRRRF